MQKNCKREKVKKQPDDTELNLFFHCEQQNSIIIVYSSKYISSNISNNIIVIETISWL